MEREETALRLLEEAVRNREWEAALTRLRPYLARLVGGYGSVLGWEDALQVARIACFQACRTWEPERGPLLPRIAVCVRAHLRDEARKVRPAVASGVWIEALPARDLFGRALARALVEGLVRACPPTPAQARALKVYLAGGVLDPGRREQTVSNKNESALRHWRAKVRKAVLGDG